jgi:flagellar biosynthesis/type III secretory pathway ATPase
MDSQLKEHDSLLRIYARGGMTKMIQLPNLDRYHRALDELNTIRAYGRVVRVTGLANEAEGLCCEVGVICTIQASGTVQPADRVVGFVTG